MGRESNGSGRREEKEGGALVTAAERLPNFFFFVFDNDTPGNACTTYYCINVMITLIKLKTHCTYPVKHDTHHN
jgi:hypothetical protein